MAMGGWPAARCLDAALSSLNTCHLGKLALGVLLDVALHKVDGQGGGAGLALPQVCRRYQN